MAEHLAPSESDLPLRLLVLRCQTGDEAAFAQLMTEFGGRTLRYLRGIVGDSADDVQQEVWLAVYRKIAELANPGAFRTWLFRTTRHRALDFLRKHKREAELIVEESKELAERVASPVEDDRANLSESMFSALDSLGPAHCEVLQLRYLDEMTYAEIALVLSCSVGTVRSRLHYAKRRLQAVVNDRSASGEDAAAPHTRRSQ